MPTINAQTTPFAAIVQTSDGTANLAFQTANVTALTINNAGAIGVGSSPSYGSAGQYLQSAGNAAPATWATIPTTTPGGSNTQVQFNNAGAFGGSANLTFNGTTLTAADITDSSLTAGRVVFPTTGGNLTGSADLFWDSANARLGIGTSSPAVQLHLNKSSGTSEVRVQSSTSFGYMSLDSSGNYIGTGTAIPTIFTTNNAERMRIDSSGNVGIGTTPAAWSGFRALQVGGTTSIWSSTSGNGSSFYSNNIYFNGSNRIYTTNGFATEYIQDSSAGAHIWFTAPSGTAGGTVTTTERMRLDASGNLLFNSGYGSVAIAYGCRAWVNFNGTGTVAIRGSGNVSSISDLNTGTYRINLSTAMPDANYSVTGTTSPNGNISDIPAATLVVSYINPPSTSSITIFTGDSRQGNFQDCPNTFVAIHR